MNDSRKAQLQQMADRWRAAPEDRELLATAIRAFREAGRRAPLALVVASDEWRPYAEFVAAWLDPPLAEGTDDSTAELESWEEEPTTQVPVFLRSLLSPLANVREPDSSAEDIERPMPSCLREWYRLVGDHSLYDDPTANCEVPYWRADQDPALLRIYTECECGWYCGVLTEFCPLPNPPVHMEELAVDPVRDWGVDPSRLVHGRFMQVTETLTQFLFGMLLRQMGLRLEAAEFMKAGVGGATFDGRWDQQPLLEQLGLSLVLDFPRGFSPYYGSDVVLIDGWGLVTRTPERFQAVSQIVRESGGKLVNQWSAS